MDTPNGYTDAPQKESVMSAAEETWNGMGAAGIGSPREAFVSGWNAGTRDALVEIASFVYDELPASGSVREAARSLILNELAKHQ
jgi:hypothetical protein